MSEAPIACSLNVKELRQRREALLPGLLSHAVSRVELVDGYRWELPSGVDFLPKIAAIIDAERRCCPFLRFQVIVEPNSGPILLDVTGPEGTRELLDELS